MFEILVYLFENYFEMDVYPDEGTLSKELSAAGFGHDEIRQAIAWIGELEILSKQSDPPDLVGSRSHRHYSDEEMTKIGTNSRGFLLFLEFSGILNPVQREQIIERIMALRDPEVSLEQVKWTILTVLWGRGQDFLFIENLLFDETRSTMH